MRKYEFTGESKKWRSRTLLHIVALRDFGDVKAGEVGGWIENESNLSHEGDCWVYDNGVVADNGVVSDNGVVCDNGIVCGNGIVTGKGIVTDTGVVYDHGIVTDNGVVCDNGRVYDNGVVRGNGAVYGNGVVKTGIIIGKVSRPYKDIFQHQCQNRVLTAILTEDNEILYTIGCQFNITKEEFIERIHNEGGGLENKPHRQEYLAIIKCVEMYFNENIK